MEFSIKSGNPEKQQSACILVGIHESARLSSAAAALDRAAAGYLSALLAAGDMDGKIGTTLLLRAVPGVAAERVLLVGLGKESGFDEARYRQAVASAVK